MRKHARSDAAPPPSVLLIGPETGERSALQSILQAAQCQTFVCARLRDAIDLLKFASVVICEPSLPDGSWRDVFRAAEALARRPSFLVTSPVADGKLLAEALNLSGQDSLVPPFRAAEVIRAVRDGHARYAGPGETSFRRTAIRERTAYRAQTAQ
jgi:DNA-binding NtrC family response regulator